MSSRPQADNRALITTDELGWCCLCFGFGHAKILQGRPREGSALKCVVRRRPSLPHGPPCSTIGAERLNFRVRNGAGCFPFAMITETLWRYSGCVNLANPHPSTNSGGVCCWVPDRISGTSQWTRSIFVGTSPRPISIGQLRALPHFHIRPITQCSAGGLT